MRRLPRILAADEVELLMAALRTDRDRAMAQAMLLGGLRRCEVLGLRLDDLRVGEWQVFIPDGKGGHERLVPISPTFFAIVADYLNAERPPDATTDRLFVSLKGPRRGHRFRRRTRRDRSAPPGPGPDSATAPVTSCATPASPG